VQTSYDLVPIGWVQSVLRVVDDTPNQREDAPHAWIRFGEQVAEDARDQRPGDKIVVLTWLHLSPRDEFIGPSCAIRPFWRQRFTDTQTTSAPWATSGYESLRYQGTMLDSRGHSPAFLSTLTWTARYARTPGG